MTSGTSKRICTNCFNDLAIDDKYLCLCKKCNELFRQNNKAIVCNPSESINLDELEREIAKLKEENYQLRRSISKSKDKIIDALRDL